MKLDLKKRNIFLVCIMLLSSIVIVYSLANIAIWLWDDYRVMKEANQIEQETAMSQIEDIDVTEEEKKVEEEQISDFDPYWDFVKMNYLQVDFSNLIKVNPEVVAWISVAGTNINYPVVHHTDNEYYLNHTFNGSKNGAGWVFLDYRNTTENLDKNTIIYAHNRKDGSMFGSLRNILNSDWYQNKSNYVIKMSTKNENNLWQVFSVYRIPVTNDYLQIDFSKDDIFLAFLNKIKERSIYDFKTTVSVNDKILTLSTCYNKKERVVMHAKLIKSQKR